MNIVFVSVVLNNHQVGIADKLFEISKGNFTFIETGQNPELERKGGEDFSTRPYLVRGDESCDRNKLYQIIDEADVMIYGAAPIEFLHHRVKSGKLTFLYSERWFKRGWKNLLSPRLLSQQLFYHLNCHGKPLYALCASAFGAKDFHRMLSFRNKCFKWGYFPPLPDVTFEEIAADTSEGDTINILWAGRFISWKHPEMMIGLAKALKLQGINYHITMIGDGLLRQAIEKESASAELNIEFLGPVHNNDVQRIMRNCHIFCFTSDRQEGWGAVLNEAMGNGCCPVASSQAGATLFLVKDGENGYIFNPTQPNDFHQKVITLIKNRTQLLTFRKKAFETIHHTWNADNAARNLYRLSEELLSGKTPSIEYGPCSKAENL